MRIVAQLIPLVVLAWLLPMDAEAQDGPPTDPRLWTAGALHGLLVDQDYPAILLLSALNRALESGSEEALAATAPLISTLTGGVDAPAAAAAALRRCRASFDPVEGTLCSLEALLPMAPGELGNELADEGARLVGMYLLPGEAALPGVGSAFAGGVASAMDPLQRFAEEALHDAWQFRMTAAGQAEEVRGVFDDVLGQVLGLSPQAGADQILGQLPSLGSLLAEYPFVAGFADGGRGPQAVLQEYQSFLNSLTGSVGSSLADLEGHVDGVMTRIGDDPFRQVSDWATQRAFVYLASQSATLAGLDAGVGERIRTMGNAASDLQRATSTFSQNLLTFGQQAAFAALGGNVLGVATNVTAFLGLSPAGMGVQAAGEIRALRETMVSMRHELDLHFDAVDARFDEVIDVLDARFASLEGLIAINSSALRGEVQAIHAEVVALGQRMDRMEENIHSYMQAGFARDYNRTLVRCLEHRERYLPPFDQMEFQVFSECLGDFRTRAVLDSRDALFTDQSTQVDDVAITTALQDHSIQALSYRLPFLARVAEQRFGYPGLRGGRGLANPVEWAVASQAYLTMLQEWPQHARSVSPGDLQAMRSVGTELEAALASVAMDPVTQTRGELPLRVLRHYQAQVATLTAESDVLARRYQQAQLRRVPGSSILNRIEPVEPGRPVLDVPARIALSVPQELRTAGILAIADATLTYRLSFEDRVVNENFRRRFLIFGRRHDRLTSTRTRIEIEIAVDGQGTVARHAVAGPFVLRLTEVISGGEGSNQVASSQVRIADPGAHFLQEIWPVLSGNASAWEIGPPSEAIVRSLESSIEDELRRHASQAVDNVFTAVCWGDPSSGMSDPDRESAQRIRSAMDGLSASRNLLQAYLRLALPRAMEGESALLSALEGPESILDRDDFCNSFAAGENPLKLVWLEEEPRRRADALAMALEQALAAEEPFPQTLSVVQVTLQQIDAAIRMQRLRTLVASAAR